MKRKRISRRRTKPFVYCTKNIVTSVFHRSFHIKISLKPKRKKKRVISLVLAGVDRVTMD